MGRPTIRRQDLSYLVVSGGTGANSFTSAFGASPAYVLPVSDDGGSSAEILRCFGGPSIGDIRSRLIRLIPQPADGSDSKDDRERRAIYNLMAHRFAPDIPEKVGRDQWEEIVEGRGPLWHGVADDKKECIRAFLVHFQALNLRRAHKRFSFRNFSIGNGFLTGARDLFSNLPSAIFLFKAVAGVNESVQVIPVINTNQTITIAAQLANGNKLVGQCNISHPAPEPSPAQNTLRRTGSLAGPPGRPPQSHIRRGNRRDSRTFDTADTPMTTPERASTPAGYGQDAEEDAIGSSNISYTKGTVEVPLEARIERLFYINLYGQEIFPLANEDFFDALEKRDVFVYSCGSLWTSIVPCLALRGLATTIASSKSLKAKVLLLNSVNDRETPGYTAMDYVDTIANTLRYFDAPTQQASESSVIWETTSFVTHVVHLEGSLVPIDVPAMKERGIKVVEIPFGVHSTPQGNPPMFSTPTIEWAMDQVVEDL